jgi:hypothetical protein
MVATDRRAGAGSCMQRGSWLQWPCMTGPRFRTLLVPPHPPAPILSPDTRVGARLWGLLWRVRLRVSAPGHEWRRACVPASLPTFTAFWPRARPLPPPPRLAPCLPPKQHALPGPPPSLRSLQERDPYRRKRQHCEQPSQGQPEGTTGRRPPSARAPPPRAACPPPVAPGASLRPCGPRAWLCERGPPCALH